MPALVRGARCGHWHNPVQAGRRERWEETFAEAKSLQHNYQALWKGVKGLKNLKAVNVSLFGSTDAKEPCSPRGEQG